MNIATIAIVSERVLELIKLILGKANIDLPDWSKVCLALILGFIILLFKDQLPAHLLEGLAAGGVGSYAYAVRRKIEPTSQVRK